MGTPFGSVQVAGLKSGRRMNAWKKKSANSWRLTLAGKGVPAAGGKAGLKAGNQGRSSPPGINGINFPLRKSKGE
ncbi:MAG: hypothetical protein C4589_09460 [Peptococcaceae bacterium]|nr:MAG: hypothetical protein C4589_09460 [Peptococcaceae bacterium]